MSALVPILRCLSPSGSRARLSILIFHRVLSVPDPLFPGVPDAGRFDQILRWIKPWFNVLPLDHAVRQLAAGTLPDRAAAITFDDGYADNFTNALPVLRANGMAATFFIATGFLDGGRMWNDTIIEAIRGCQRTAIDFDALSLGRLSLATAPERRVAIDTCIARAKYLPPAQRIAFAERVAVIAGVRPPSDLMMSSADVRELRRAGMQIGAHTVSHPILATLAIEDARQEIAGSREHLEHILGERVGLFAYPNGEPEKDYRAEHATLAREIGFDAAVSTRTGAAGAGADLMQLPRFTPWDQSRWRFAVRLVQNLSF